MPSEVDKALKHMVQAKKALEKAGVSERLYDLAGKVDDRLDVENYKDYFDVQKASEHDNRIRFKGYPGEAEFVLALKNAIEGILGEVNKKQRDKLIPKLINLMESTYNMEINTSCLSTLNCFCGDDEGIYAGIDVVFDNESGIRGRYLSLEMFQNYYTWPFISFDWRLRSFWKLFIDWRFSRLGVALHEFCDILFRKRWDKEIILDYLMNPNDITKLKDLLRLL